MKLKSSVMPKIYSHREFLSFYDKSYQKIITPHQRALNWLLCKSALLNQKSNYAQIYKFDFL